MKGATGFSALDDASQVISIHAPVKGATRNGLALRMLPNTISIHAPVKGATNIPVEPALKGRFQSTLP